MSSPTCRRACAARRSRRPRRAERSCRAAGALSCIEIPPHIDPHRRLNPTHRRGRRDMAEMTRRDMLKVAAAGAGAALSGLPHGAQAQTTQKRELVVAQGGDIAFFDPHMSTSSNDIRISFNLYDNLTSRRPDGKLAPGLATEWKLQGQTTWAFKLRSGVKWHNGDTFSSADAKFSIERTYDPNAKMRVSTVFTTVERIEAPDAATLVIHTKKPDSLLPARLGFYGGQNVPQKKLDAR